MKKEIKGFICGVLSTVVIGVGVVSASGIWDNISVLRNDITVIVNGNEVAADNFVYKDTTYLPLRAVSEALEQPVEYDETTNTAYIGERKDDNNLNNKETINKYTPLHKPWVLVFCVQKDGVYYISPGYIEEIKGYPYVSDNTNIADWANEDNLDLIICGQHWAMEVVDGIKVIPFDTFVDEVLPLVGIDPSTVIE